MKSKGLFCISNLRFLCCNKNEIMAVNTASLVNFPFCNRKDI